MDRLFTRVTGVSTLIEQRQVVADFLEELSLCVHSGNTAQLFLSKLKKIEEKLRDEALPKDWDVFEEQAQVYYILKEIEQYLVIKKSLKVAYA